MAIEGINFKVGMDTSGFTRGINTMQSQADSFASGMQKLGGVIAGAIGGAAVISAIKNTTDAFFEFEQGLGSIGTLLGGDIDKMEKYGDVAQNVMRLTNESTQEATQSTYDFLSAFGELEEGAEILEVAASAAVGGVTDTGSAVKLLSSVIKGYGLSATADLAENITDLAFTAVKLGETTFPELQSQMGRLVPTANALSIAQEELFAVMASGTGALGNTSETATKFAATMNAMIKPTESMKQAMATYAQSVGLGKDSTADMLIESEGFMNVLKGIVSQANGNINALGEMFGRQEALNFALAMSDSLSEKYINSLEEMQDASGATAKAYETQTNTMAFATESMKTEANLLKIAVGDLLATIGLPFVEKLTEKLGNWTESLKVAKDDFISWRDELNKRTSIDMKMTFILDSVVDLAKSTLKKGEQIVSSFADYVRTDVLGLQATGDSEVKLDDIGVFISGALTITDYFLDWAEGQAIKLSNAIAAKDETLKPLIDGKLDLKDVKVFVRGTLNVGKTLFDWAAGSAVELSKAIAQKYPDIKPPESDEFNIGTLSIIGQGIWKGFSNVADIIAAAQTEIDGWFTKQTGSETAGSLLSNVPMTIALTFAINAAQQGIKTLMMNAPSLAAGLIDMGGKVGLAYGMTILFNDVQSGNVTEGIVKQAIAGALGVGVGLLTGNIAAGTLAYGITIAIEDIILKKGTEDYYNTLEKQSEEFAKVLVETMPDGITQDEKVRVARFWNDYKKTLNQVQARDDWEMLLTVDQQEVVRAAEKIVEGLNTELRKDPAKIDLSQAGQLLGFAELPNFQQAQKEFLDEWEGGGLGVQLQFSEAQQQLQDFQNNLEPLILTGEIQDIFPDWDTTKEKTIGKNLVSNVITPLISKLGDAEKNVATFRDNVNKFFERLVVGGDINEQIKKTEETIAGINQAIKERQGKGIFTEKSKREIEDLQSQLANARGHLDYLNGLEADAKVSVPGLNLVNFGLSVTEGFLSLISQGAESVVKATLEGDTEGINGLYSEVKELAGKTNTTTMKFVAENKFSSVSDVVQKAIDGILSSSDTTIGKLGNLNDYINEIFGSDATPREKSLKINAVVDEAKDSIKEVNEISMTDKAFIIDGVTEYANLALEEIRREQIDDKEVGIYGDTDLFYSDVDDLTMRGSVGTATVDLMANPSNVTETVAGMETLPIAEPEVLFDPNTDYVDSAIDKIDTPITVPVSFQVGTGSGGGGGGSFGSDPFPSNPLLFPFLRGGSGGTGGGDIFSREQSSALPEKINLPQTSTIINQNNNFNGDVIEDSTASKQKITRWVFEALEEAGLVKA